MRKPRDDNSLIMAKICIMIIIMINNAVVPLVADGRKLVSVPFIGLQGREYRARTLAAIGKHGADHTYGTAIGTRWPTPWPRFSLLS